MPSMSKHNRRDGYWKYYHLAHTLEKNPIVSNIVSLVKENPPPRQKKSNRGRKQVHSWEKMVCICILMVIFNKTYKDMQNEVPSPKLPWNEPYPDHTWIAKTFKKIPLQIWKAFSRKQHLCASRNRTGRMADSEGNFDKMTFHVTDDLKRGMGEIHYNATRKGNLAYVDNFIDRFALAGLQKFSANIADEIFDVYFQSIDLEVLTLFLVKIRRA